MAGSSRKKNVKAEERKRKKAEEQQRRNEALSSPGMLEIHYSDLRRREACTQTKPLSQFLTWAREEKLVIFSEAYHDYVVFGKFPAVEGDAKLWCPFIETDCMIPENTACEFFPYRNAMYVDDLSKKIYQEDLRQVVAREKAYRSFRRVMREEAGFIEKGSPGDDKGEEEEKAEKPLTGQEKEEENAFAGSIEKGIPSNDKAEEEEKAEKPSTEQEKEENTSAEESNKIAGDSPADDSPADDKEGYVETLSDVEGWKMKVARGKAPVPLNDILMQLLETSSLTAATVVGLKTSVAGLTTSVEGLTTSVATIQGQIAELQRQTKAAHKSISDNGEAITRATLSMFLQDMLGSCGKKICLPVLGRKLPFVAFEPLERLATLCLNAEKKARSRPIEVEIDIFVKLIDEHSTLRSYTPPRAPHAMTLASLSGFTSLIIGENTRSESLCSDSYVHPTLPEASKSSKLLYKFIQVERGLMALMSYYYVGQESLAGAFIISPSFKNLSTSASLIDEVLEGCTTAFPNIAHLHANHKMWLTSL